jgi:hypothetical protein
MHNHNYPHYFAGVPPGGTHQVPQLFQQASMPPQYGMGPGPSSAGPFAGGHAPATYPAGQAQPKFEQLFPTQAGYQVGGLHQGEHASNAAGKHFKMIKTQQFKGTRKEEGTVGVRFIKTIEMYRDAVPMMEDEQLSMLAVHNMADSAKDWFFTEDEVHRARTCWGLTHDWATFRRAFLVRYGTVDPAESAERLNQLQQGKDESVANLAQRARELLVQSGMLNESVKVHRFKMALKEPLRSQLHTRGASTFENAITTAVELEKGLWAMENFKVPSQERHTVRMAEEKPAQPVPEAPKVASEPPKQAPNGEHA